MLANMTQGKQTAPTFAFDPNLLPDDNIELFYKHLESIDPEMAEILNVNMPKLLPFPEDTQVRTPLRTKFNKSVMVALEKIVSTPTPDASILPDED